ncbi:MAG TPA: amino acid adenylation domain-containing protein, partial [Thermoanaerobaculia bacterium]|nr:amino acid adenylation domain-containing protein [Thermoanaerobaculia bacterium]
EATAWYEAFAGGVASRLAELPIQYADCAAWQRRWLQGEVLAGLLAYWRQRLSGLPAVLELPVDRPRRPLPGTRAGWRRLSVAPEVLLALRRLGRREGATLFMTMLASFEALLGRWSGQRDLAVGTPVAGRGQLELEALVGCFVNTLVLRGELGGDPSFRELVGRVREGLLGAYAHQELPFERLVEELKVDRSLVHSPLFQVMFVLNPPVAPETVGGGLRWRSVVSGAGTAQFDLTLSLAEQGDGLVGTLEYRAELFDAATIERLAGQFAVLAAAVAGDCRAALERRLSVLPLLTAAEAMQLAGEWNDTAVAGEHAMLVHEAFMAQAALRPGAPAVVSPHGRLTYGALDRRSNRLARRLRALGVGPEVVVAICAERTLARVVGVVAVLKAGGAYLSLDPSHPPERLSFQLEDSGAAVLLREGVQPLLASEIEARVVSIDLGEAAADETDAPPPERRVRPENLAYVIYTSGSTGRPKGVAIPHAGLTNLVLWHQRQYAVGPEDRGTLLASPAFDASVWELWPYLAAGGCVHIPDEETRLSPAAMVRWWSAEGITHSFLMTVLAERLLEEGPPAELPLCLRALLVGGDRLHRGPSASGLRLVNHYGPSEYSVVATAGPVPAATAGVPAIGRPIANTRLVVADAAGQAVPIGVPGELWVGGAGLARGYLHRPDLTAERFVPDPASGVWSEPGARLYRTGDLVRWLADGRLDFLGRIDHQVKLRGLRIELGEIESVLALHPAVREAAVLLRELRAGDPALVAYVAASGEPVPAAEELRTFLRRRLPEFMVPASFVFLDLLPTTPNGKVDREALLEIS